MATNPPDLSWRLEQLENLVIHSIAGLAGFALVLGMWLPLWSEEHTDDGPVTGRLLTLPGRAEMWQGEVIPLGIGFTGLLVCVFGCLWFLLGPVASRQGTARSKVVASFFVCLAAIGVAIALLLTMSPPESTDVTRGWAPLPLAVGLGLCWWLLGSSALRSLWQTRR